MGTYNPMQHSSPPAVWAEFRTRYITTMAIIGTSRKAILRTDLNGDDDNMIHKHQELTTITSNRNDAYKWGSVGEH